MSVPDDQHHHEYVPLDATSLFWSLGYPRTNLLATGRALLMQVSHPTIAAGILKHSKYLADPWGRMRRSRESTLLRLFGGCLGVSEGVRLQRMHSSIEGTDLVGNPYSALDLEPWQWTYSASFDSILYYYRNYSRRLKVDDESRLYSEWRYAGAQIGIRPSSMPTTLSQFEEYVQEMIVARLDNNDASRSLLHAFTFGEVERPWKFLPHSLWPVGRHIARQVLKTGAIGSLPALLREKLNIDWTQQDERLLLRLKLAIRTIDHYTPSKLLHDQMAYAAVRASRAPLRIRSLP
ncbi:oxygenase MpaB family protein [Acrocarpospora pleiomorpha]|nr:oxygenase MpaB family protein [Acrocarpospora pleiomorpha]